MSGLMAWKYAAKKGLATTLLATLPVKREEV